PAAEEDGGGAEVDLDALDVERVAGEPAEIPHAVAEDVGLRREAAEDEGVALAAALTDADGDAGDVPQGVADGGRALLLDDGLGDDDDRLRRVHQGLR